MDRQVRGSVGASSKLAAGAKGSKASKGSKIPVRQVIMKAAAKAEAKGGKSSPAQGKGEAKAVVVSPYKAKGANVDAAKVAAKGTAKGMAKGATKGTAAKAAGKGAGPATGDSKDKERYVVAKIPRLGTISKWLGNYGHLSAMGSNIEATPWDTILIISNHKYIAHGRTPKKT